MRRLVFATFILISFLAVAQHVDAAGLTISSDEACDITPGRYSIGVTNEQAATETLRITALGAQRSWVILGNTKLVLNPGESGIFELSAAAPSNAHAGFYNIPVIIYSEENDAVREETTICLIVKRVDQIAIKGIAFADDSLSPGELLKFSIVTENVGTEPFKNVDVDIEVSGPQALTFADDRVTLLRGESKVITRELHIDNLVKTGHYSVRVTLIKDGDILDVAEQPFTIESVRMVDRNERENDLVLLFSSTTTLSNTGNVETVEIVAVSVPKPFNAFVSAPGAIQTSADKAVIYTWAVPLEPGEATTVSYTVHYWPFLVILIVLLYAAYQFYVTSKRPIINKRMLSSKKLKDDIQEFAIAIEVKNTTPVTLKNVTVRDFVPAVARVYKDFKVQPERAKFVEVGTELVWKFKEMKPAEARVVHYRISTVAGTIDNFWLPPAVVEGSHARRSYRVHSSTVMVGSRADRGRV